MAETETQRLFMLLLYDIMSIRHRRQLWKKPSWTQKDGGFTRLGWTKPVFTPPETSCCCLWSKISLSWQQEDAGGGGGRGGGANKGPGGLMGPPLLAGPSQYTLHSTPTYLSLLPSFAESWHLNTHYIQHFKQCYITIIETHESYNTS
jgi:hypothetical protein